MKYEARARRRRGQCLSPHTAPSLCDNDILPVWGIIELWGSGSAGGEIPVERSTW